MNTLQDKIDALTRPNIRALKPYSSARDEAPKAGNSNPRIMLDANENSFGGPLDDDYARYPDPQQRGLKAAFSKIKGVSPDQIFLGNGSDEAIDLLFRAFVEPGKDNIILMPPTYGMYAVQANIHGAAIRTAPLQADFSPNPAAVMNCADANSKLLFICSPNNPTGNRFPDAFILEMLAKFPGIVVVDEAYGDFSKESSWVSRLDEFPNLAVLQTLSKAWGLAGLRIGAAFANPLIINILNKVKFPYNLNTLTIQLATKALSLSAITAEKTRRILLERERLSSALEQMPGVEKVFPSDANFLLIRVLDADALYLFLAQHSVIVRNRNRELHCANCLRITVGTPAENDRVLSLMRDFQTNSAENL